MPTKDKNHHKKKDEFNDLSFGLISIILNDDSIREIKEWNKCDKNKWNKIINLAKQAKEKLKDLEWFFQQSSSTADEISGSFNERTKLLNHISGLEEELQKHKAEAKESKNENKKVNDAKERALQSMQELQETNNALRRQIELLNSGSKIAAKCILSEDGANKVQGTHNVGSVNSEMDCELSNLEFPPIPDSMILDECFPLDFGSGRAISWSDFPWGDEKGEGSSNADETCIFRGYTVYKRNDGTLNEILETYPKIIGENFGAAHSDLQSYFMNSLAELYQKIKGDQPEKLDLKEIEGMGLKVLDMERNGLQELSWLKNMLTEVREMLENEAERKRLEEQMANVAAREEKFQQEVEEARQEKKRLELELAKLGKKPRLQ